MKYYVVEYNVLGINPKQIWADEFRVSSDGLWVEFIAGGVTTAFVRKDTILAINCKYETAAPGEAALGDAVAQRASGSAPTGGQPPTSPAAGPVEAAMRRQGETGRPVTPVPA